MSRRRPLTFGHSNTQSLVPVIGQAGRCMWGLGRSQALSQPGTGPGPSSRLPYLVATGVWRVRSDRALVSLNPSLKTQAVAGVLGLEAGAGRKARRGAAARRGHPAPTSPRRSASSSTTPVRRCATPPPFASAGRAAPGGAPGAREHTTPRRVHRGWLSLLETCHRRRQGLDEVG